MLKETIPTNAREGSDGFLNNKTTEIQETASILVYTSIYFFFFLS
jgi:hypothetical protein